MTEQGKNIAEARVAMQGLTLKKRDLEEQAVDIVKTLATEDIDIKQPSKTKMPDATKERKRAEREERERKEKAMTDAWLKAQRLKKQPETGYDAPKHEFPASSTSAAHTSGDDISLQLETAIQSLQQTTAMKSLHRAQFIQDLSEISYPPVFVEPNPALNANASSDRKFKYNREFLLQFQDVLKEKHSYD